MEDRAKRTSGEIMSSKSLFVSFIVATAMLWNVAYYVGNQTVSDSSTETKKVFIVSISE